MKNRKIEAVKEGKCSVKLKAIFLTPLLLLTVSFTHGQLKWINVDSSYQPLPPSVHVYFTDSKIDTSAFRAYYLVADLKDKKLEFTADTSKNRRLTPTKFYEKNDKPLAVVNCTFFSFATNQNLNVVIKNGKLVGYNIHTINGRGKDTFTYRHPLGSAIGITRNREADIAWVCTDSSLKYPYARPLPVMAIKDSVDHFTITDAKKILSRVIDPDKKTVIDFDKWKMETAVGGGPVL